MHHNKLRMINEIVDFLEDENVSLGERVEKFKKKIQRILCR